MARSTKAIAIDPPYDKELNGILSFKTFHDAERTLQRLEDLRQMYSVRGDKKGCDYCRQVALAGRHRAEGISRDRRVQDSKRLQKKEIAYWFQMWLETPDLFGDWLALRKRAASFVTLSDSGDAKAASEEA